MTATGDRVVERLLPTVQALEDALDRIGRLDEP